MFCSRCGTNVKEGSKFCPSCGLDLSAQTPLGRTTDAPQEMTELDMVQQALQDEYEIQKELGRGGMAIVFRAKEKLLDREVAVKVLPFSLAFDQEFVERFQREARTAARLEHPSIIPIYRVGKSGRVIYFVMKFLRGTSLSDVLEQKGPMAPAEIRKILGQTASALGYAHKHEIVHRDIKPDNIMFDEMGHAVVTDFGIAKAASGTRLTGTGMSIGTPHYMSPEQAKAQPLDGRSDIYSLGVVAYQCLTGGVPFDGEDAFSIGYKHIMEELPTPPNLPTVEHRKLLGIIRKMMAKSADERFQTAEDVVKALEGRAAMPEPDETMLEAPPEAATVAMPGMATTGRGTAQGARPSTPTTPMPRASLGPPPAPKKRRTGLVAASLVLLVLGGGGAGGYFYASSSLCPDSPDHPVCAMLPGITTVTTPPDTARDTTRLATADPAPADSTGATTDTGRATSPPADTGRMVAADTGAQTPAATTGTLVLNGVPEGARVAINDQPPSRATRFELPPGSHRITVTATGYRPYSANPSVARGQTETHRVSMERVPQPQCDSPTQANYNLNQACFDRVPRFMGSQVLDVSRVTGDLPAQAVFYVQLNASGGFVRATAAFGRDEIAAHEALMQVIPLALPHLQQSQYQAATKGGRAVDAWFQVLLRLQR